VPSRKIINGSEVGGIRKNERKEKPGKSGMVRCKKSGRKAGWTSFSRSG
jgi:hypothetical protein